MFVRAIGILCAVILAVSVFSAPAGATTWNVSTSSQFDTDCASAAAGDTIICAAGDYYPSHAAYFSVANITLEGATGNAADVRIHGDGMNVNSGDSRMNLIQFAASGFTIKDLTVQDVGQNGIQIHGEDTITSGNIIDVHTLNCGERAIKASGSNCTDSNITIKNCVLAQNEVRSGYSANGLDYIGGIDAMSTSNWNVTNNVMQNIQGATGGGRGAIFIWNGTNDTVQNNTIIGCDRGICMGNPSSSPGPSSSIVKNNFITAGAGFALELCTTSSVNVYDNTIYNPTASANTVHIYGTQTSLKAENDIIRGAIDYDTGGTWTSTNNIIDSTGSTGTSAWFQNVTTGDLHLTTSATSAIGHGISLSQVATDIDGQTRKNPTDIGADQYSSSGPFIVVNGDGAGNPVPEPASMSLLALGALALLRRKR